MDELLRTKTLVMIIGPAAIGKSTLMNRVVEQNNNFGRVSGFTSRPKRANDEPGLYRYVSSDEARRIIHSPTTVQYAVHPTTGFVYGSEASDYPATYNLLDTLSTVVENLRQLPFARTVTISITTDAGTWQKWFFARYPQPNTERRKRLEEAIESIEWSLAQTTEHSWLINRPGELEVETTQLIDIVLTNRPAPPEAATVANSLLQSVKTLLSYEQKEHHG